MFLINFRIRIQAANCIGVGQFSPILKLKTKSLPPAAPRIECTSVTHNSLRLKFTPSELSQSKNQQQQQQQALQVSALEYKLEMLHMDQFEHLYQGSSNTYKVNKLNESSAYLFRVCAINEAGQGAWSGLCTFSTSKSPPSQLKCPTISDVSVNSCLVEWNRAKIASGCDNNSIECEQAISDESIEYVLQIQAVKTGEFREIYRGECTSFRLYDLEPNCEYNVRVAAVRVCASHRIQSQFSGCTLFNTKSDKKVQSKSGVVARESTSSILKRFFACLFVVNGSKTGANKLSLVKSMLLQRQLSDQEWAAIILVIFAIGAVLFAFIAHYIYISYYGEAINY